MPCYSPLQAYRDDEGKITFTDGSRERATFLPLELPCGQCIGCRLKRSRDWAMRIMHESSLHQENCFLTLTIAEENMPFRPDLDHSLIQVFMRSLRKRTGRKLRFFCCGEYGGQFGRPHYHLILFGMNFNEDRRAIRQLDSGCKVFRSPFLEKVWTHGWSSIGDVTFESAAYVARYCVGKVTGQKAVEHYARVDEFGEWEQTPEYAQMSRADGIGKAWFDKFHSDVYPHDYVVVGGMKLPPPRYYDNLYDEKDPEGLEYIKFLRSLDAELRFADNTPRRLSDKETVARAKLEMFKRNEL